MQKKLHLKLIKLKRALVMQVLEQEGEFEPSEHVDTVLTPGLSCDRIYLRGSRQDRDLEPNIMTFDTDVQRDVYLDKVINWITNEQFKLESKELQVGEICETKYSFSDVWEQHRLLAILPKKCFNRYITTYNNSQGWLAWEQARPLVRYIKPKISNNIYKWEMSF
jgi:hypothetical protein